MNLAAFSWGAWFALAATLIVILGQLSGASADNVLLSDPYRAAGAGFMWGVLVWNVREWLIARQRGL